MAEHTGGPLDADLPSGNDEFEVNENWVGQVVVLSVSGAVDMLSAPQLTEAIGAALPKQPAGLVVDLSKVDFLSSAGMSVLVNAHEQIAPSARFAVVADGPATSRPIKLVGVADIVDLYTTLDAALTAFTDG
jgi:anti-sigma B factor antagonist